MAWCRRIKDRCQHERLAVSVDLLCSIYFESKWVFHNGFVISFQFSCRFGWSFSSSSFEIWWEIIPLKYHRERYGEDWNRNKDGSATTTKRSQMKLFSKLSNRRGQPRKLFAVNEAEMKPKISNLNPKQFEEEPKSREFNLLAQWRDEWNKQFTEDLIGLTRLFPHFWLRRQMSGSLHLKLRLVKIQLASRSAKQSNLISFQSEHNNPRFQSASTEGKTGERLCCA